MARVTTTLSVFLASPSDVEHERQIVAKVIDRWNHIRGREKSIYFDLIRWETSVSSGFGEDGQQVINQQIGEEYDLLIAMFWSRIGTSTVRSVSGTTEEYERALQRFRTDGSVDIAFYFKDAPISMEHIIPEQIGGLRKLQLRLQDEGAFYKSFKDDDGL